MKKKPVWSGIGDFAWDAIRRWRQTYRTFLLRFQPARQWAPDPDRFRSTFLPGLALHPISATHVK
jgi:hypothetical protein